MDSRNNNYSRNSNINQNDISFQSSSQVIVNSTSPQSVVPRVSRNSNLKSVSSRNASRFNSPRRNTQNSRKYTTRPWDIPPNKLKCIKCLQELVIELFSKPQIKFWRKQKATMHKENKSFEQLPPLLRDGPYCLNCALKPRTDMECKRCTETKPLSEFSRNQRKRNHEAVCLACVRDYNMEEYSEDDNFDLDGNYSEDDYDKIFSKATVSVIETNDPSTVGTSIDGLGFLETINSGVDRMSEPSTVETNFTTASIMTDQQIRAQKRDKFFSDDEDEEESDDEKNEDKKESDDEKNEDEKSDSDTLRPIHQSRPQPRNLDRYQRLSNSRHTPTRITPSYHGQSERYAEPSSFSRTSHAQSNFNRYRDYYEPTAYNRYDTDRNYNPRKGESSRYGYPTPPSEIFDHQLDMYSERRPRHDINSRPNNFDNRRLGARQPVYERNSRSPRSRYSSNSSRYNDIYSINTSSLYVDAHLANSSSFYADTRSQATTSPQRTESETRSEFSFTEGKRFYDNRDK